MTEFTKDLIQNSSNLKELLKIEFKNFSNDDFKYFLQFIGNNPDLQSAYQAMLIFKQDPNANNVETSLNISFLYNREITDIDNNITVFDAKEKNLIPAYSLSNSHAIDDDQYEYNRTQIAITSRLEFNKLVNSYFPNQNFTVPDFFLKFVDEVINPSAKGSELNIAVTQSLLYTFIPSISNKEKLNLIKSDFNLSKIKFNDIKSLQNCIKIAINNIRDKVTFIREELKNEREGNNLNERNERASTVDQREMSSSDKQELSSLSGGRTRGNELHSEYGTDRSVEIGSVNQGVGSFSMHLSSNEDSRDAISTVHSISESATTDELVSGRSTFRSKSEPEYAYGSDVSVQTNENYRDDFRRETDKVYQRERKEDQEVPFSDPERTEREESLLRTERSTSETVRNSESVLRHSERTSAIIGSESSRGSNSGYRGDQTTESADVLSDPRKNRESATADSGIYRATTSTRSERSEENSKESFNAGQENESKSGGLSDTINDRTTVHSNRADFHESSLNISEQHLSGHSDVNSESSAIESGSTNSKVTNQVAASVLNAQTDEIHNYKSEHVSSENTFSKLINQNALSPVLSAKGSNAYIEESDFSSLDNDSDYVNEKERFIKNLNALNLLKNLDKDERNELTDEEKKTLLGYTGFGGFNYESFENDPVYFKDTYYSNRRDALMDVGVTENEYFNILKSCSTAYFTHTDLIDCIYEKLEEFGFNGGKVLEPSCGVGKFIGRMPKELAANSEVTGVEIDPVTAKIASLLYPQSTIKNTGFEKTFAENYYDVAVGNVPFGSFTVSDPKNPELNNLSIHNYFFEKALKEVKPGGVIAFITSSMTLDSKSSFHREELAKKAHFLGAVRLPNNTFKNSNADVMTDIVFLKKRDVPLQSIDNADPQFDWVNSVGSIEAYDKKSGKSESKTIYLNSYFKSHPEQIAGELVIGSSAYGPRYEVESNSENFSKDNIEQIRAALKNVSNTNLQEVSAQVFDDSVSDSTDEFSDPKFKEASLYTYYIDSNDVVRYKTTNYEIPKELIVRNKPLNAKSLKIVKDLTEIKNIYKNLRKLEIDNAPEPELSELRQKLNDAYDNFRKNNLSRVMQAKRYFPKATDKPVLDYFLDYFNLYEDNSYGCLAFLENTDSNGQYLGKHKIFKEKFLFKNEEITTAANVQEALAHSINLKGSVDIPYIANLLNRDPNEVAESMLKDKFVYIDPEQIIFDENQHIVDFSGFVTENEYLSGNIYKKIDSLNNFQNKHKIDFLNSQLEDLKKVIPQPLSEVEISAKIGARWIDTEYYTKFLDEFCKNGGINGTFLFDSNVDKYFYTSRDSSKVFDYGIDCTVTYAVETNTGRNRNKLTAADIFLKMLNGESLVVKKTVLANVYDEKLNKTVEKSTKVDDEEATAAVLSIAEKMENYFEQWIFSDLDRKTKLVDKYNRLFNSIRPRQYNGELFTFNDINPEIKLRPHQKNAIARSILGGNALFAHEVGAGKTFEMCVSAMEKIRLGKAHRCVFVMPKAILPQFANDFYRLYPDINLLIPETSDFSGENRRKFINRLTFGDYKIILMSKEQFNKIPMSDDYQDNFIKSRIENQRELLKNGHLSRLLKKNIETNINKLQSKLEKLYKVTDEDGEIKDLKLGVTFEELGCDALFVDEAHNYKNAYLECHTDGVALNSKYSSLALDMQMKCDYLNNKYNNKAIVFATGTPLSNSVVDLYTMQTYLNQPSLNDAGIYSLDAFIAQFGSISSEPELDATAQQFEFKSRLRSFRNVPDALKIFGECADIKTSADLKDILTLPTPHFHIVTSPASKTQQDMIENISARALKVKNGSVDKHVDNMLLISSDGRKIGLDPRLIDPLCPDNPDSKINKCAENIKKIYDEDPIAAQLVFCDLGTPDDTKEFNVYKDLKDKLVDMGLKPSEVRFIHEFIKDDAREKCFDDVNSGGIRVLIGSTSKLGTGVNVQKCLKAVHHLDINWRPSDLEQRNGRIIRQGNSYDDVDIYTYVSVGTFDSFMFQTVKRKADFIKKIMNDPSSNGSRNVDLEKEEVKFSLEDCLAVSIRDPRIREQLSLQREIGQLESEKKYFINNLSNISIQVNNILPTNISNCKKNLDLSEKAISILKNNDDAKKIILSNEKSPENESVKDEKKFFSMELVTGKYFNIPKTFTDLQSAGEQILAVAAITNNNSKNYLGVFCGLRMYVKKVQSINQNNTLCYKNYVYFAHPESLEFFNESLPVELGSSPTGNISRITNAIKNLILQSGKFRTELNKLENELKDKSEFLENHQNWDKEDLLKEKKEQYSVLSNEISSGCDNSQKSDDLFLDEIRNESNDLIIEEAEIVQDNTQEQNLHDHESVNEKLLNNDHVEIVNVTPDLIADEYQQQFESSPSFETESEIDDQEQDLQKNDPSELEDLDSNSSLAVTDNTLYKKSFKR